MRSYFYMIQIHLKGIKYTNTYLTPDLEYSATRLVTFYPSAETRDCLWPVFKAVQSIVFALHLGCPRWVQSWVCPAPSQGPWWTQTLCSRSPRCSRQSSGCASNDITAKGSDTWMGVYRGGVTHMHAPVNQAIIGSRNGLAPNRRQAIM